MRETNAIAWLKNVTKKYKCAVGILTAMEIAISLFGVCYALVMKQMVDCAVAKDGHGFVTGMVGFALLVIGQLVLRIISRQLSESVRSNMENRLKRRLFAMLFQKDYACVSAVHSEEWMNRLTSDTVVCANGMTDILPGFIGMMIRLLGSLVLIFYLQPQLAWIIVPGGIVFVILTWVLRMPLKRFHKEVQETDGKVRIYLQERISSMLVERTFGVENAAVTGAEEPMQVHRKARLRKAWISNICNSGFALAIHAMYLLGIGYCGYGIIHGVVSYGTLTAIIQLIGQLQSPLAGLSGFVPRYYAMTASAERLMEAEQLADVPMEHVLSKEEVRKRYAEDVMQIVFEDVVFDYNGQTDGDTHKAVLQNISYEIQKGDYVAITGTSGCGKSTMLKLLMGIYEPQAGTVKVVMKDGTALPVSDMRRLFAYVPQGNFLMGGSIRDVITFAQDSDLGQLRQVLKLACADFVYDLPDGVETVLGERGAGLSEGQMQRIAIARALYADCPILILDESTSALDEQTERQLLQNLKELTDKTVFIVTHRAQALTICNQKLALNQE